MPTVRRLLGTQAHLNHPAVLQGDRVTILLEMHRLRFSTSLQLGLLCHPLPLPSFKTFRMGLLWPLPGLHLQRTARPGENRGLSRISQADPLSHRRLGHLLIRDRRTYPFLLMVL